MTTWTGENRGNPTDQLVIGSMDLSPDSPQPGDTLTAVIKGTVSDSIPWDGAYADVTVRLGLIKLLTKQYSMTDLLQGGERNISLTVDAGGDAAMLKPGDVQLTIAVQLPRSVPRARFRVVAHAYTATDDYLASLDWDVNLIG